MSINRTVGLEDRNGALVGRDPREMTTAELEQLGQQRMSPMKTLRLRCLDCCAGSTARVRLCVSVTCPSWPFRMGENPWRAAPSESKREQARALTARRMFLAENERQHRSSIETQEGAATTLPGKPRAAESTAGIGSKSEGGHDH
ncbi:MAG: hypothetical protein B7Y80_18670 [Hyphomicrobium sp. 32-62-53]|nr:MAG: hypothetical protein B7Z29_17365 [Hyphomicrobium sp. 12-62-95]OYX97645.1 MAG: hypothetical protein B7Y80_18670 [Hyphomicrobium sp. 32-62-53]